MLLFCTAMARRMQALLLLFSVLQHGCVMISLSRMLEANNVDFPLLLGDSDGESFGRYCR